MLWNEYDTNDIDLVMEALTGWRWEGTIRRDLIGRGVKRDKTKNAGITGISYKYKGKSPRYSNKILSINPFRNAFLDERSAFGKRAIIVSRTDLRLGNDSRHQQQQAGSLTFSRQSSDLAYEGCGGCGGCGGSSALPGTAPRRSVLGPGSGHQTCPIQRSSRRLP